MNLDVKIRIANDNDMQSIWELVYELAVFEKEPEEVKTTPEIFKLHFLENRFESHVATVDGKIIGMILYYETYSTWKGKMLYLDDFVVMPSYRNHKIGQLLFNKLIEIARKKEVALIKWQVLDWNTDAIRFYDKNNAIIDQIWCNGRLFLK
jgi:GNAT superfamily N-acetyltransferase